MPSVSATKTQETASLKSSISAVTTAFILKSTDLLTTDTGSAVKNKKMFAFGTKIMQGLASEEAKAASTFLLNTNIAYYETAPDAATITSDITNLNFNGLNGWEVLAGVTILD